MYYTYVLQSMKDNDFYTGYTRDLKLRFEQHQKGRRQTTDIRGQKSEVGRKGKRTPRLNALRASFGIQRGKEGGIKENTQRRQILAKTKLY